MLLVILKAKKLLKHLQKRITKNKTKKISIEKVKAINYMSNGKVMIIHLINSWIDKKHKE